MIAQLVVLLVCLVAFYFAWRWEPTYRYEKLRLFALTSLGIIVFALLMSLSGVWAGLATVRE